MAKYDDLCALSQAALSRYTQYTADCYEFADSFFSGMKEYFNYPEEALGFYPVTDTFDASELCTLHDAMQHCPDGFFELYFSLTLKQPSLKDTILAAMRVKKNTDSFIVRLGMSRREFEIHSREDLTQAYDYIFDAIKNYYERDGFIKSASNPIGFAL